MNISTMKKPSAWIPLAMSFAALATVLGHVAMFGVAREADEGTAAHIWQILMAAQIPVVVFFAIKWLPRTPRQSTAGTGTTSWCRARRTCTRFLSQPLSREVAYYAQTKLF